MQVKLVSITKSLIEEKELTPEELIVYIARVSNPSNQLNIETSSKLIEYLIRHKHWSPFEMVDMTVEVVTSRAIAQQIIRHKSLSVQEFSQRYSEALGIEPIQLRKKAKTNRQSSEEEIGNQDLYEKIDWLFSNSTMLYDELIQQGVAKECARMVLPLCTQTRLYLKGSVRSWIHYLQVRLHGTTQLEHRQVAEGIYDIFSQNFPTISKHICQPSSEYLLRLQK